MVHRLSQATRDSVSDTSDDTRSYRRGLMIDIEARIHLGDIGQPQFAAFDHKIDQRLDDIEPDAARRGRADARSDRRREHVETERQVNVIDLRNKCGECLLRRLHLFVAYKHDAELLRTHEQCTRIRISTNAEAGVAERPAACLAIVRDLQERRTRVATLGVPQIEMCVEVDDADACSGFAC